MIYFVRSIETGLIKIGTSANFPKRIQQLRAQHGELEFLGGMVGDEVDETRIHRRFHMYHVTDAPGEEWFADSLGLRMFIATEAKLDMPESREPALLSNRFEALVVRKWGYLPAQVEIARAIGINQTEVSRWMRQQVYALTESTVRPICDFLGCGIGDLVYFED